MNTPILRFLDRMGVWKRVWAIGLLLSSTTVFAQASAKVPILDVKTRQPAIPFHLDRSPSALAKIASVRLFVRADGSEQWHEVVRQSPQATQFHPHFDSDGLYHLSIRTADHAGKLYPANELSTDLQVRVDTAAPFLRVKLVPQPNGGFEAKIRASDANLNADSLVVQIVAQATGHIKPADNVDVKRDAAGVDAKAVWSRSLENADRIRVVIQDRAGNTTTQEVGRNGQTPPKILQVAAEASPILQAPTVGDSVFTVPGPKSSSTPRIAPIPPRKTPIAPAPTPVETPDVSTSPKPENNSPATRLNIARSELLLRAARNAVKLEDLPEAFERFGELLELDPGNNQARYEYAGLLIQEGRLSDARAQYQTLVTQAPSETNYRKGFADLLIQIGDYEAARSELLWLIQVPGEQTAAAVKLAKTYAWEQQNEEAVRVYDTYLKSLTNLGYADQRELAQLLMTMNRTQEAVRLLVPLYQHRGEHQYDSESSEQLLADLILAHTRLMQRSAATVYLDDLRQLVIEHPGLWLKLADQLYLELAYVEALAVFEKISPESGLYYQAKLGTARTHLRLYETTMARQCLDEIKSQHEHHTRDYTTVEADYHTVIGNWTAAIAIAQQRLREDPHDHEAMILLGNAYRSSGQYLKAREVYQSALTVSAETDELQLLLGQNFLEQRLFDQAAMTLEALQASPQGNIAARLLLVQTLRKSKRYTEAEQIARPQPNDIDPRHRFALRTELAYVLLDQGRLSEASREFESLIEIPDGITPDVAYGLYRAQLELKHPHAARGALLLGPTATSPPAEWAMIVAGRAMADCDCPLASEVLDQFLQLMPNHIAALNLRGEAAHQCDCCCKKPCDESGCGLDECGSGCGPEAVSFFELVLEQEPHNTRARLGLSRSLVKHHYFDRAMAEYRQLITAQPDNINIRRELGRMLDGWKGIEHAEQWYASAFEFDSASPLIGVGGHGGGGQIQLLASESSIIGGGGAQSNELMTTEYQAKYLRGWRNRKAVPLYEGLIALEPTNEEAYFDLGQVHAGLNRTRCAIHDYERLLEINPCHAEAWQAYQRLHLELRPQVRTQFLYTNKDGRDGLANIRWVEPTISGVFPLGDVDEYLQFGYRHRVLRPTDDRVNHGEIGFVRLQEKLSADWLLFGEVDVEEYDYGFQTRPTFEAGTQYTFGNDVVVRGLGFLNNVFENGESIRQDIYRAGFQLEGAWKPKRRWLVSGFYRWADYSDSNNLNEFGVSGGYDVLRGRRQLRALADFNYLDYSEQSILAGGPSSIVGTVHPYFAPQSFSFASMGLEWKHWLSCHNFQGADQWWYRVYMGGRFDSQSESYFLFQGEMLYDIRSWLTLSVEASIIESEVYDENRLGTYGVIRFR